MRATRLDDCCKPLAPATACAQIVSDGFISVNYAPSISEGEAIEVRNASGVLCVSDPGCDEMQWVDLTIEFCQVNPQLLNFLTGNPIVLDYKGDAVGNRLSKKINCTGGFGLEVWTNLPQEACTAAGLKQYGYFLAPCVSRGIVQEWTIENDALTMSVTGRTRAGGGWGIGPYNVDPIDAANTAGKLNTPILADEHMDIHLTSIAPPVAACDCLAAPAA
jgi:hypothetical protein